MRRASTFTRIFARRLLKCAGSWSLPGVAPIVTRMWSSKGEVCGQTPPDSTEVRRLLWRCRFSLPDMQLPAHLLSRILVSHYTTVHQCNAITCLHRPSLQCMACFKATARPCNCLTVSSPRLSTGATRCVEVARLEMLFAKVISRPSVAHTADPPPPAGRFLGARRARARGE